MIASQALFLQAILKGDRIAADQIVREALQAGTLRDIYLQVFQPSLYEVGRLWEIGQVSIAQEHLATAITQSALASIYAQVDLPASTEQNAIIACLSGNYHEIGPRMLADFMQMAGFNTRFLGADTPADSLMSMISSIKPDVIGLPATTQEQVQSVQTAIARIRADFASYRPTVMVGGLAFNLVDDLWKKVKADVWGMDAGQAVDHLMGTAEWA